MGFLSYLKLRRIEKNTRPVVKTASEREFDAVALQQSGANARNWTRAELDANPELLETPGGAWAR
jgi:hypothetical protein